MSEGDRAHRQSLKTARCKRDSHYSLSLST